jgi:hypothetical protein
VSSAHLNNLKRHSHSICSVTFSLGLCTIHRIDGITVAIYSGHHHPVGVTSRFEPYMATAQMTPYLTVFYGCIRLVYGHKYGYHCLSILHCYNFLLQREKYCKKLARRRLWMGPKISTSTPATEVNKRLHVQFCVNVFVAHSSPSAVLIHDSLENAARLAKLGQCLAIVTAPHD